MVGFSGLRCAIRADSAACQAGKFAKEPFRVQTQKNQAIVLYRFVPFRLPCVTCYIFLEGYLFLDFLFLFWNFCCFSWRVASVASGFCGFWLLWLLYLFIPIYLSIFLSFFWQLFSFLFLYFLFLLFSLQRRNKQASKQASKRELLTFGSGVLLGGALRPPQPLPRHEICTSSPTPAPATKSIF